MMVIVFMRIRKPDGGIAGQGKNIVMPSSIFEVGSHGSRPQPTVRKKLTQSVRGIPIDIWGSAT
jgi:hypothetical protein